MASGGVEFLQKGFERAFLGSIHPATLGATLRVVRLRAFLGGLDAPLHGFASAHERVVRGRAAAMRSTPFLRWAEAGGAAPGH